MGLTLLPKISWGWLPFCFTFLGFSPALKLLLFITLFSVYSAAILYRLYLHSDKQGKMSLAGERGGCTARSSESGGACRCACSSTSRPAVTGTPAD